MTEEEVWSERIDCPTSLSFTNPGIKPFKEKKINSLPWCNRQALHFYVSLPRALPSVLFAMPALTALSCKFLHCSKSTFFSSQVQAVSRSRQRQCLLCISGTRELVPALPLSPSIPSALHVGICTAVGVLPAEES